MKNINEKIILEDGTYVITDIHEENSTYSLRKYGYMESDFYITFSDADRLDEALSISARRKRSMSAKRNKTKLALGRKRAAMKAPTKEKLMARAEKRARAQFAASLSKGTYDTGSAADKARIEDRLKKLGPRIDVLAKRLLPAVRKDAAAKRLGGSSK